MCDAYFLKNREKVRYKEMCAFFIPSTLFKCLSSEGREDGQLQESESDIEKSRHKSKSLTAV